MPTLQVIRWYKHSVRQYSIFLWAIALLFAGARSLRDSCASRPCVKLSAFEMVEMDRIVSGKRGWMTRGLMEYAWWGDRSSKQEIRL